MRPGVVICIVALLGTLSDPALAAPSLKRARVNGVELEYAISGKGDLILLIHGSVLADALHGGDGRASKAPVLSVVGALSAPPFKESHALLRQWFPRGDESVVPEANHALQMANPRAVAEGLARFCSRHPGH